MSQKVSLHRHHRIINAPIETPLGSILLAGLHLFGHGVNPNGRLRTYPGAAIVFVTRGEGIYKDSRGKRTPVKRGDVIFVFPGVPHWYGPQKDQIWDEIYIAFEGPIFDPWYKTGIFDPLNPIRTLPDSFDDKASWILLWIERFADLKDQTKQIQAIMGLNQFLADTMLNDSVLNSKSEDWLAKAKSELSSNLEREIELEKVAESLNMGYEAFRKRFQKVAGISPLRYRNEKRIEAAKQMFQFSPQIGNREVAEALGFSDEFHFSKRFRAITGESPNQFRKRVAAR